MFDHAVVVSAEGMSVMRVVADRNRCDGYANCVVAAPDVFDLGDDGVVVVLDDSPPEEMRQDVERAVDDCPVAALRIDSE